MKNQFYDIKEVNLCKGLIKAIPVVKNKEFLTSEVVSKITPIEEYLNELFGVNTLRVSTRMMPTVFARQLGMVIARIIYPKLSLGSIGAYFAGKDHATVIHAIKTIRDDVVTKPKDKYKRYDKICESFEFFDISLDAVHTLSTKKSEY